MSDDMKSYLAVQVGYTEDFMNICAIYNLINACLPDDVKLSVAQNDLNKEILIKMIGGGADKELSVDYGNVIVLINDKLIILSMDNFLKYFWTSTNQIEKENTNLFGLMKCHSYEEDK